MSSLLVLCGYENDRAHCGLLNEIISAVTREDMAGDVGPILSSAIGTP